MGLGVWFADDIERILAALASSGVHHGPAYHKALSDVAVALGTVPPSPVWSVLPTVLTIEGVNHERQTVD